MNQRIEKPEREEMASVINRQDFWLKVRASESRLLALDYDGTLAPFHQDPMKAFPLPGVIEAIKTLKEASGVTVAIISGRPVYELSALLGNIGVTFIGCHGFELMNPNGKLIVKNPSPLQLEGIDTAQIMLSREDSGAWIETKTAGIALHTRGMPAAEALAIENQVFHRWALLASAYDLECRRFNGGVELRAKGRHKGDALIDILLKQPERTLALYVGDDETDEDAFRVVRDYGVGVRVGGLTPETHATEFLQDCREVMDFIEKLVKITAQERSWTNNGNA